MSAAFVHKAAYDALRKDSDLTALLGSAAIYDAPPAGRSFPFVQIGNVVGDDWSNDTNFGQAMTLTLYCWSKQKGRKQIYAIAERVSEIMKTSFIGPADADWNLIVTHPINSRFERDVQGRVTKATLRFRILVEPAQ